MILSSHLLYERALTYCRSRQSWLVKVHTSIEIIIEQFGESKFVWYILYVNFTFYSYFLCGNFFDAKYIVHERLVDISSWLFFTYNGWNWYNNFYSNFIIVKVMFGACPFLHFHGYSSITANQNCEGKAVAQAGPLGCVTIDVQRVWLQRCNDGFLILTCLRFYECSDNGGVVTRWEIYGEKFVQRANYTYIFSNELSIWCLMEQKLCEPISDHVTICHTKLNQCQV